MATTPNTNHSRQLQGCRTCMGHYQGQQVPGHGHAPQLDTKQGPTMAVLSYLGPRQTQQSNHAPIHCRIRFVYLNPPSLPTNQAHLSLANLSCGGVLNPVFHPGQVTQMLSAFHR